MYCFIYYVSFYLIIYKKKDEINSLNEVFHFNLLSQDKKIEKKIEKKMNDIEMSIYFIKNINLFKENNESMSKKLLSFTEEIKL